LGGNDITGIGGKKESRRETRVLVIIMEKGEGVESQYGRDIQRQKPLNPESPVFQGHRSNLTKKEWREKGFKGELILQKTGRD